MDKGKVKMNSSRAWIIDLIHSIGEKLALCDHLAEKLDDENVRKLYDKIVAERRNEMELLTQYADDPNLEYWCAFKHAVKQWVLASECYDYMPNEKNLNVVKYSADILAGVVSLFLGLEFEDCARCLNDRLLLNQRKEKKWKK